HAFLVLPVGAINQHFKNDMEQNAKDSKAEEERKVMKIKVMKDWYSIDSCTDFLIVLHTFAFLIIFIMYKNLLGTIFSYAYDITEVTKR
ncbi:hypothetical protein MKW98_001283, partial [Papaver atlanticum]